MLPFSNDVLLVLPPTHAAPLQDLASRWRSQLQARGHEVSQTPWPEAKASPLAHHPLFLLVQSPDDTPLSMLQQLLQSWADQHPVKPRPPILLLRHPQAAGDTCIRALALGADDCACQSVDPLEICLRSEALLRRCTTPAKPAVCDTQLSLQCGALHLRRQPQEARLGEQLIELTPVQFRLLWCLVNHSDRVLSKADLHRRVLDKPYCRDDRSIDMHLSRVRKKLQAAGCANDQLQTVHGRGYCFVSSLQL